MQPNILEAILVLVQCKKYKYHDNSVFIDKKSMQWVSWVLTRHFEFK